jgi:hypothetical protein
MKKIIEESQAEGLEALLGERITVFCCRYIYTGKLIGVDEKCIKVTDCGIVYETGELTSNDWTDYQKLPHDWYVALSSIESFGILK